MRNKIIRNKAVHILIIFLLMLSLVCFFWGNPLIGRAIESALQAMVGAKVEIDGFRLHPFQMSVQMDRIQITNPADTWKNLISARRISFKLAPGPLFEGKKVIDEIVVADLVFNEPRQTDGRIKKPTSKSKEKKESKLSRTLATMPILRPETIAANLDLEKITASYQFKTDLSAARIKGELDAYKQRCDANLEELNHLQAELKKSGEQIAKMKKPGSLWELHQQLALAEEIGEALKEIHRSFQAADDRFQRDHQELAEAIRGLRAEAEADYQALLAMAELPDLGKTNYAEALLGETILNASTMVFKLIDFLQARRGAKEDHPPRVKPTRSGQDIVFPGRKTYPRLLIKKIDISGRGTPASSLDGWYAGGVLTGITSEPSLYGLPATILLYAQTPRQALFRLEGELNHVTPEFQDRINITIKGLPLSQTDLGDNYYLPTKILTGEAGIDAVLKIDPDLVKLEALMTIDQIKTDFSGQSAPEDLITEIVRNTFANLDQVTLNYELTQDKGQWEIKISSNLNRMISARLQEAVGERVTGFTRDLRAKVDEKLYRAEESLETLKARYQEGVAAKFQEFTEELDRSEEEFKAKQRELEKEKDNLEKAWQKERETKEESLKEDVEKLGDELERLKDLF